MKLPRWMHRAYAWALGYFWLPCPLCGRHFGGHEWLDSTDEHPATNGDRMAICPDCTRAGRGEHVLPEGVRYVCLHYPDGRTQLVSAEEYADAERIAVHMRRLIDKALTEVEQETP